MTAMDVCRWHTSIAGRAEGETAWLRVDYFILGPPSREELATGLAVCVDRRRRLAGTRNEVITA